MSEHTIILRHETREIKTKTDAFGFGFAEAFGKAAGWAVVVGLFFWAAGPFIGSDDEPKTEQAE